MTLPLSVCLIPLGCPKNLVDSEKMLADLAEAGCIVGASADEADVIVINSCGFLAASRAETLEVIEEATKMRSLGNCSRIVVAGCLPNRDGEKLLEIEGVDVIVGASSRINIVEAVLGSIGRKSYLTTTPHTFVDGAVGDAGRFRLTLPHTAYLRIAEGCSRTCAFCTIPQIRGPFRSKPMGMILDEARELIDSGAKELSIIAQDTACWGRELPDPSTLATLLRELNGLDGAEWIRVLYAYPNLFDRDLRDVFNECDKVVRYVDMPLQHVSSSVLSRMRRNITREQILDTVTDLREHVNTMAMRTTFITGFPGETQEEFDELHRFIQEFHFDALGVFEFSPEEGTAAATMDDQIPVEVARERAEILMATQRDIVETANENSMGRRLDVLVDGVDEEGYCIGRHSGQAPEIDGVCFFTEPREPGEMVSCEVTDFDGYDLIVTPV